jgi:hypothetical protein
MKKNLIIALNMLFAVFAFGQNQNLKEIEVTAPQFTGLKNAIETQNKSANVTIKTYLKENVGFPADAVTCKAEGTEVIQFTVTAEGNVADFKIINSVCSEIDNEITRVLKKTNGMWLPGSNNGKPVEMTQEVSMIFCVDKKTSESITEMFSEKATNYFSSGTVALFVKKNPQKALKFYNYGINYLPYNENLLLMRGICRYELGDKAGAQEDWHRITNLDGIDLSEYSALIEKMKGYNELMVMMNNE